MFGTLGGPELFLIFVVALIVFGPRKLPEIGKSLGKMMAEFRRASNDFRSTIESEVEAEKIRDSLKIEPPKLEPVSPARALPPETGTGYPEAAATTADTFAQAPEAGAAASPESPPARDAGAQPVVEPVAEAVSRESAPASRD